MVVRTKMTTERREPEQRRDRERGSASAEMERGLNALLARGREMARSSHRPVLVSRVESAPARDPLDLFRRAAGLVADRVYWEQPDEGFALVGIGAAQVTEAEAGDRFERVADAWRGLLADALIECTSDEAPAAGPLLLGGFSFDPARPSTSLWDGFPAARFILPRLLLTTRDDQCWLTLNALVWPDSDPVAEGAELARLWGVCLSDAEAGACNAPLQRSRGGHAATPMPCDVSGRGALHAPAGDAAGPCSQADLPSPSRWRAIVADGADAVRRGGFEKVVLARAVQIEAAQPFDVDDALGRLRASYPTCRVFAVARGARVFLGATPERLVRLRGGEVRVDCLAGSIRRGATLEEDARLGAALLASAKDRAEHAVVLRSIREALDGLCDEVAASDEPGLLSVRNVHHLYTPVIGRLREGASLLDLVERLHPTPAVGGRPRDGALAYIRIHEGLDRGWYAAPVGWLGRNGGEFGVALRSALVDGHVATLFAGCGIMGDSDPDEEYAESAVKLRPMLTALGAADALTGVSEPEAAR